MENELKRFQEWFRSSAVDVDPVGPYNVARMAWLAQQYEIDRLRTALENAHNTFVDVEDAVTDQWVVKRCRKEIVAISSALKQPEDEKACPGCGGDGAIWDGISHPDNPNLMPCPSCSSTQEGEGSD